MIFDVDKAADFLGVSVETIRSLARNKRIPAAKVGRQWRFHEEDLTTFVRSQYGESNNGTVAIESGNGSKAPVHPSMAT